MESNRKRKGFIKGKLMPLYRVAKSSSSTEQYSSKVKPSQYSSPATASVGYVVHQMQHQEYVIAQPKQKVTFIVPSLDNNNRRKLFGDESIDVKAASYISSVQERFKLERLNSERIMKHDQDSTY